MFQEDSSLRSEWATTGTKSRQDVGESSRRLGVILPINQHLSFKKKKLPQSLESARSIKEANVPEGLEAITTVITRAHHGQLSTAGIVRMKEQKAR